MAKFLTLGNKYIITINPIKIVEYKIKQSVLHQIIHDDLGKSSLIQNICQNPAVIFDLKDSTLNLLKLYCAFKEYSSQKRIKNKKSELKYTRIPKKILEKSNKNNIDLFKPIIYLEDLVFEDKRARFLCEILKMKKEAWSRLEKEDFLGFHHIIKKLKKKHFVEPSYEYKAYIHVQNFKKSYVEGKDHDLIKDPVNLKKLEEYFSENETSDVFLKRMNLEFRIHRSFCCEIIENDYCKIMNHKMEYDKMLKQLSDNFVIEKCNIISPLYPEVRIFNAYVDFLNDGTEITKDMLHFKKFKTLNEKGIKKYIKDNILRKKAKKITQKNNN